MRRVNCFALAASALFLFTPRAGSAEVPVNGIPIGIAVQTLVQTLGPPLNVSSDDNGNRFVFAGGSSAYADDDGIVLAVDTQTGSPRIDIDGTVRSFRIGNYSVAQADADLASIAEFATPNLRSYRLAPRRDLVLAFAQASQRLERVTYGEPGQLARLGLLPGDGAAKVVVYHAPQRRSLATGTAPTGPRSAVCRVAINRTGAVTAVDVLIASTIPTGADACAQRLENGRYTPATLDGRPIAATIFVEIHP